MSVAAHPAVDLSRATDVLRALRLDSLCALGQSPNAVFSGGVFFYSEGWLLEVYWNAGYFGYIERIVAPDGSFGTCEEWWAESESEDRHPCFGPEDALSDEEFSRLIVALDQAPTKPWSAEGQARLQATFAIH